MLGSYFFHDIIPWDDDIDVLVDFRDYPKFKRAFHNASVWKRFHLHGFWDISNEYDFKNLTTIFPDKENNITRNHMVKIYFANATRTFNYPWRWPFIDIFYFKQNNTHVWYLFEGNVQYTPIQEFYPFHLRPYMGMWLPVPHKPAKNLKDCYGATFVWTPGQWNHKMESLIPGKRLSFPFKEIKSAYVNISRHECGSGTVELVHISGDPMYSVYVNEPIDDAAILKVK